MNFLSSFAAALPCDAFPVQPCAVLSKSKRRKLRDRRVAIRHSLIHSRNLKGELGVLGDQEEKELMTDQSYDKLSRLEARMDDVLLHVELQSKFMWAVLSGDFSSLPFNQSAWGVAAEDLASQCKAARCIQQAWRTHVAKKEYAINQIVFCTWRPSRINIFQDSSTLRMELQDEAAVIIQARWRTLKSHEFAMCNDPFVFLSGMAADPDEPRASILLNCAADSPVLFEGESLVVQRLQTRQRSVLLERRAREACKSTESVGICGTVAELKNKTLLMLGTLLESTEYVDVYLDGFNGIRYLTGGPVIAVSDTEYMGRDVTVFRDASDSPGRDLRGRVVFGEIGRGNEIFCIVGNTRFGGQQVSVEELDHG